MDPLAVLSPEAVALLRHHGMLQQLAVSQVMAEVAEGVALSEEEWGQVRLQLCQQLRLQEPSQLEEEVAKQGKDLQQLLDFTARPVRLRRYGLEHFGHKVEQHFLARKGDLDQVVYSLIRVQDRDLAQEIYLRLAGNEGNFADLAAQYAEGPERSTRGIVGPCSMSKAHPLLRELLRTSSPGELRQPIQVEGWHLVVRLESMQPASLDAVTQAVMAQELLQHWAHQQAQRRIAALTGQLVTDETPPE